MLALEDGVVFEGWSFGCWGEKADEVAIRSQSVAHNIPCITTLSGAEAVVNAIESLERGMSVKSVQEYHRSIPPSPSLQKTVKAYPTVA